MGSRKRRSSTLRPSGSRKGIFRRRRISESRDRRYVLDRDNGVVRYASDSSRRSVSNVPSRTRMADYVMAQPSFANMMANQDMSRNRVLYNQTFDHLMQEHIEKLESLIKKYREKGLRAPSFCLCGNKRGKIGKIVKRSCSLIPLKGSSSSFFVRRPHHRFTKSFRQCHVNHNHKHNTKAMDDLSSDFSDNDDCNALAPYQRRNKRSHKKLAPKKSVQSTDNSTQVTPKKSVAVVAKVTTRQKGANRKKTAKKNNKKGKKGREDDDDEDFSYSSSDEENRSGDRYDEDESSDDEDYRRKNKKKKTGDRKRKRDEDGDSSSSDDDSDRSRDRKRKRARSSATDSNEDSQSYVSSSEDDDRKPQPKKTTKKGKKKNTKGAGKSVKTKKPVGVKRRKPTRTMRKRIPAKRRRVDTILFGDGELMDQDDAVSNGSMPGQRGSREIEVLFRSSDFGMCECKNNWYDRCVCGRKSSGGLMQDADKDKDLEDLRRRFHKE
ncbi:NKAP family protein-like [Ctenocephalides felis]|uniref:NKAP family protein-like n=1 Tax=Ctenocephalides felis TaxID=7515 RepID=UPI000E6E34D7|nr:NKAP family protein-like [Ctenocephalides felis]